jgi:hypothetical protein
MEGGSVWEGGSRAKADADGPWTRKFAEPLVLRDPQAHDRSAPITRRNNRGGIMFRTCALTAAAALALLAFARSATADATCPPDSLRLYNGPVADVTAADHDTSLSNFYGTYHVAWDLTAGSIHMDQCCSLAGAWVKVGDAYDVLGVPVGTAVTVTALLTVSGSVSTSGCGGSGCGGYYGARLEHGANAPQVVRSVGLFSGSASFVDVIPLTFTIVAGTPETLFMSAWGARSPGGSHASQADGVLTFAGLPPGATIVSCQGYGAGVVSSRATTWGRLKTMYR